MKTVVGNWKMNVGVRESVALARGSLLALRGRKLAPELIICPSFVALSEVRKVIARSSLLLGAQNLFSEDHGAFTGETSGRMLTELGVTHVIVGHSERRRLFGETGSVINKKIQSALTDQLIPILCVGETAAERASGAQRDTVRAQLADALQGIRLKSPTQLFVAYEPVWAIGTGKIPEVSEIVLMHQFIRETLTSLFSSFKTSSIRLLYGGSVDGSNAYQLLRESEIDGVLVGSASIKMGQFNEIIMAASEVLTAQSVL